MGSKIMSEFHIHPLLLSPSNLVDLQTGEYKDPVVVLSNRGGNWSDSPEHLDIDSEAEPDWFSLYIEYAARHATWVSHYPPDSSFDSIAHFWHNAETALRYLDTEEPVSLLPLGPSFFSLEDALRELEEVREEAEEAYTSDDKIDPVPDSAYDDANALLELLHRNVPIPDMMWSEDGGLGFEWRPGSGIATISLYGDNLAIYGAFFDNNRQVEGICSLSDTILLQGFLTTLRKLFE